MSTKNKILDAAESLFADKGFSGTSLREITSLAEVNLAAVNYHFGSKKELIKSVMSRYMDELAPNLVAGTLDNAPMKLPIGVLTAETITTFLFMIYFFKIELRIYYFYW